MEANFPNISNKVSRSMKMGPIPLKNEKTKRWTPVGNIKNKVD